MQSFARLALAALIFTLAGPPVQAQQCDLNRKTITFNITVCSQQGCTPGAERVDIIGSHVVHYTSASAGVGTVYTIGQTTDLCRDQANAGLWLPRCSDANNFVKANATAVYTGGELKLTIEQAYSSKFNNQLSARVVHVMRIGIMSCNACQVLESTSTGFNAAGAQPLLTMGGSSGCLISELSP
jgi:hypothetical protein